MPRATQIMDFMGILAPAIDVSEETDRHGH
jgi:hypothetical protein